MQSEPAVPRSMPGAGAKEALPQSAETALVDRRLAGSRRFRLVGSSIYLAALTLAFIVPLTRLLAYASANPLHSHIPIVPVIVGYLLYLQAQSRPSVDSFRTSLVGTAILAAVGVAAVGIATYSNGVSVNDHLGLLALAYVSFIAAGGFLFLGTQWMAAATFPMFFLVFIVPLPDAAASWLERGLVVASADASAMLFSLTGTPMWRDGTFIGLPGIVLHVAQECSGIRSTWVLFITSLLASHLLLSTQWRRAVLIFLVIPLGILRNAVRIVVIGLLCVNVGPHMIDSAIHRRGGPVFFAVSLVPLFLTAVWLHRQERRHAPR